jgi:hypothetical protein
MHFFLDFVECFGEIPVQNKAVTHANHVLPAEVRISITHTALISEHCAKIHFIHRY